MGAEKFRKSLDDICSLCAVRFAILITPREKLASHGADTIQFLLAPHSGAEFMELGRTASGGEMSRIMLAIEVSLASEADSAGHTFVFDEVDAGIGGKSALAVFLFASSETFSLEIYLNSCVVCALMYVCMHVCL